MKRRNFIAGAVVLPLAIPAVAQTVQKLIFVPQGNLASLDPVWTTATVTRNFSFLVYDTLYGLDSKLGVHPQMAEGHSISDDGLRWTVRLREGLRFHDNEPVLARDCVASLQRWMKRDLLGQTLASRLDVLDAPDDRTLVFRLKRRFAALAFALARSQPSPPVIQPARLAATDPFKQVTEVVGSGPFRFVPGEYVSGSQAIFARFEAYQSRSEPADFTGGAKRALVERVEWRIMPDPATQANALMTGEVDWVEQPLPDLLEKLRGNKNVIVEKLDPYGVYPVLRMNHQQPPTNNLALRQAILAAIDPTEVMQALMGDDTGAYTAPIGAFLPGTESANDAGMDRLGGKKSLAELRQMVAASGAGAERFVLMHPTDQPFYDAMTQVVAARLKQVGVNVEEQAMDFGTVVQRRNSREPLDKGGWSGFISGFPAADYIDPLVAMGVRGNGAGAWYGWPESAAIEAARNAWMESTDIAERQKLARDIQLEAFSNVQYVPLGQYRQSTAWRRNLSGLLPGPAPVFWNVTKT